MNSIFPHMVEYTYESTLKYQETDQEGKGEDVVGGLEEWVKTGLCLLVHLCL